MLLERSDVLLDLSNPDIVLGPHKCCPTERMLENGDPLACKRARKVHVSTAETLTNASRDKENHGDRLSSMAPLTQLTRQSRPTNSTKSGDNQTSDGAQAIVLEDSDEEGSDDEGDRGDSGEATNEDDDAELERLQKDWDTPIYVFFKPLPSIQYIQNRKAHIFECAATQCHCRTRSVCWFLDTTNAKSTSNLWCHAKVCWGDKAVEAANGTKDIRAMRTALQSLKTVNGSITATFQQVGEGKVQYSHRQHTKSEARAEFVRWVTENNRPFQIVNDRSFQCLMKMGRPDCYIPSAETLSRDIKHVFVWVRGRLAKALKEYDGKLNFATDSWSLPNHKSYVAMTVHFERAGKLFVMLLDLVEVAESHTGVNLGTAFANVLKKFRIEDRILGITGDNASNNDTMIKYLGDNLDKFPSAANQTRCFVHTINLVAKAILRSFDIQRKKNIRDFNNVAHALADMAEGDEEEEHAEHEEEDEHEDKEDEEEENHASLAPIRLTLLKLRKIAITLKNSMTILLPAWYKTLSAHSLPPCMMPRDVATHWNSTFDMLEFATRYHAAIDAMTAVRDFDLRKYKLVPAKWKIAIELQEVLKIFKDATMFFSCGTPNLATVIPAMEHIDGVLTKSSDSSSKFCLAIRAALTIGKRVLHKYYNKTRESDVYRIAMVLHPRHKLEYFRRNDWDDTLIDAACNIVQDEYDRSYWLMDVEDKGTTEVDRNTAALTQTPSETNIFDSLMDDTPTASVEDELQCYLEMDVKDVKDGLMWWHKRRTKFLRLSRMARDYLSIPATTVNVERVFSHGHLVLLHVHSRLVVQSTRTSLCVGLWSIQGLVRDSDVRVALSAHEIDGEEGELPENWDDIHAL